MYSFPISCMLDPFPISFPPSIDVFQLLSQLALLSLLLFCFQLSLSFCPSGAVYLVLFHCLGVGRCGIRLFRYGVCSSSFKGAVSKKAKHRVPRGVCFIRVSREVFRISVFWVEVGMLRVVSILYVLHFPIIHLLSRKMPSSIRRERVSYGMHCPKRMWRGPRKGPVFRFCFFIESRRLQRAIPPSFT